jgi:type I restriction enzyme, S subunit
MNLPLNWKWVKLGDLVQINPKLPNKDSFKDDMEVQFLPMKLVEEVIGKIHLSELRRYSEVQKSYTSFIDGDVIFAKVTPCMENGKIAVVDNLKNGVGFGSSEFHVIRPSNSISNKFIFNYIVQNRFRNEAQNEMTGAVGLRRVPKQFIENYRFPLPPLSEQHAIVSKIEALLSELDKGKQQLETAQQQLKIYRQAVLKWAFEGKLTNKCVKEGELPLGWKWVKLNDVSKILSGYAFKSSDFIDKGVPVIKIANVGYSSFEFKAQQFLPRTFLNEQKNFKIVSGDLLIALTRPITNNTTKVCKYPLNSEPALLNQRVASIKEAITATDYLFWYFQTDNFKNFIRSKFSETLQPNLSPKDLELTPLPLPPIEVQHQIIQEIESRLSVCDKVEETITTSLAQAETLRQSILKKAFEGKLV